jgi:hypothetical protein
MNRLSPLCSSVTIDCAISQRCLRIGLVEPVNFDGGSAYQT